MEVLTLRRFAQAIYRSKYPKKIVAVIMQPWLFLEFNSWIPPKMRQTVLWQLKKLSKIYSKACLLICFYIKMFPTPTFVKQDFFRNCQFLTHLLLIFLNILTILWTFYIVASARSLQIWNLQYLSFHLTPDCLVWRNWPNIRKWNAKAQKHKCAPPGFSNLPMPPWVLGM